MNPGLYGFPFGFSGARLRNTVSQNVNNTTTTFVTWDTEDFDTADYHTAQNPTRLTIPVAGYYLVGCTLQWDANQSGVRFTVLVKNGVTRVGGKGEIGNTTTSAQVLLSLLPGDYLEAAAFQDSGGTRVLTVTSERMNFWILRVG